MGDAMVCRFTCGTSLETAELFDQRLWRNDCGAAVADLSILSTGVKDLSLTVGVNDLLVTIGVNDLLVTVWLGLNDGALLIRPLLKLSAREKPDDPRI